MGAGDTCEGEGEERREEGVQMIVRREKLCWLCSLFDLQLKNMMVIGIDTYHDSSQKGRSAVGFTASMNAALTRYVCVLPHLAC